jgi:hypothetical protein
MDLLAGDAGIVDEADALDDNLRIVVGGARGEPPPR